MGELGWGLGMRVDWGGNVDGGWGQLLFQFFRLRVSLFQRSPKGFYWFLLWSVASFDQFDSILCLQMLASFIVYVLLNPFFLLLTKAILLVLDVLHPTLRFIFYVTFCLLVCLCLCVCFFNPLSTLSVYICYHLFI